LKGDHPFTQSYNFVFSGLFVPFANGRGVLCGAICALVLCSWISLGGLAHSPGMNHYPSINYRAVCNISGGPYHSVSGRYADSEVLCFFFINK
jgi:hypothetical protein